MSELRKKTVARSSGQDATCVLNNAGLSSAVALELRHNSRDNVVVKKTQGSTKKLLETFAMCLDVSKEVLMCLGDGIRARTSLDRRPSCSWRRSRAVFLGIDLLWSNVELLLVL